MRPQSIVWFERLYLAAFALMVVNTILSWDANAAALAANGTARDIPGYQYWTTGIGLLIPPLLWFFIARRGSAVAKWILLVLVVIGLIGVGYIVTSGRATFGLRGLLGYAAMALQVAAAAMLFRPDADAWFGKGNAREPVE